MRSLIIIIILSISFQTFALNKGDFYFGPALGRHGFDAGHNLESGANGALRMGILPFENFAIEGEYEFISTGYEGQHGTMVDTYQLAAVKYFRLAERLSPFVLLGGVYTKYSDEKLAGVSAGVGLNYKPFKILSFDMRVKRVFYEGGMTDTVPMFGVNIHFNSK